jgi:TPR repeat protein
VFNKNEQALDYLILLADRGRARDQVRLGMIYAEGKGVEKDYKKAVEWIRKAADQGDDDAKMVLGSFYFQGHGVLTDHIEAYKWFLSAGDKGKKITAEIEELLTAEQVVIWRRRLGPDFLRSKR